MSHGGMTLSARALGFLFRSNSKGMISLTAIEAREVLSFDAAGGGRL
jgi:hypothetical protein